MKLPGTSGSNTFTWTDELSEGGLIKHPEDLSANTQELEKIFNFVNGTDTIQICKNYIQNLLHVTNG